MKKTKLLQKAISVVCATSLLLTSLQISVPATEVKAAPVSSAEAINDKATTMAVNGYSFDHSYVKPGDTLKVLLNSSEVTSGIKWTVKKVASGQADNKVEYTTVATKTDVAALEITANYLESVIYAEVGGEKLTIYCSKTPVMYVNSDSAYYDVTKEYSDATVNLVGNDTYNDPNLWYNGVAEIKLRGNSTAYRPKRPFKVKLDSKADLLGLGVDDDGISYKSKHWVLLANDIDHTLIRNKLLYDFSGDIGTEFHFESTNVTVIYNGQYEGVYQLCEHRRVDEGRIDITDWTGIGEDAADTIGKALASKNEWSKNERKAFISELEETFATDYSWIDNKKIYYSGDTLDDASTYTPLDDLNCTEAFTTATEWIELNGDFDVTFKFHNAGYKKNNAHDNFCIELKSDESWLTAVANGNIWWADNSDKGWGGTTLNECTDVDKNILSNGDVTLNITRRDNIITMRANIVNSSSGKEATMTTQAINDVDFPETLQLHITGEECDITNITYKENLLLDFSDDIYNGLDRDIPATTGGFLGEMDFYSKNPDVVGTVASLETAYAQPLYFSHPEPGEDAVTNTQKKAIVNSFKSTSLFGNAKTYLQTFEYSLHSDDFYFDNTNATYTADLSWAWLDERTQLWTGERYNKNNYVDYENNGKHYSELFDMDSLVNNFIFCEYAMNWDSMKNSFFYYKDIEGLAKVGPQWDFDWSLGNINMFNKYTWYPTSWHTTINEFTTEQYYQTVQWNRMLIRDPYFLTLAYEKYTEIRPIIENMIKSGGLIDTYYANLKEAGAVNDLRWQYTYGTEYGSGTAVGFEQSITNIKNFLNTRVAWLDKQFVSVDKLVSSLGYYKTSSDMDVKVDTGVLSTKFTATATNSAVKKVTFQINGTTQITADVKNGVATATIATSKLNASSLNMVVANAVNSLGKYIYNASASKTGNYNVVKSDYATFTLIPATSVKLNKTAATITNGSKLQLTTSVLPSNASNKSVTWTSSNTKVATVVNGVVVAKGVGTTTITAKTTDGTNKTATCVITVKCKAASFKLVKSTNSVSFKWSKVAGASKYQIYRATSKKGSYKRISTTKKLKYSDKKAKKGKTYYYKIKAVGSATQYNSAYSSVKSAMIPKNCRKIKAKKIAKKSVSLSWTKVSKGSGYEIYRSTKKKSRFKKIKTISKAKTVKYTNKKLKSGKTYYYKVRAYKKVRGIKIYSSYSKTLRVKTKK